MGLSTMLSIASYSQVTKTKQKNGQNSHKILYLLNHSSTHRYRQVGGSNNLYCMNLYHVIICQNTGSRTLKQTEYFQY